MRRHSWENNFSTIQSLVKNYEDLTLKQMFDVTAQLVKNQGEIHGLDKIQWEKYSWKRLSLIGDETVINLQSTKVYVFSDSVLCLGRVLQHPDSNEAWKLGSLEEQSYRNPIREKLQRLWGCQWRVDWIRVEHFPWIHWAIWDKHQKLSQEEFYFCQCSMTSPVTEKATKMNAWQMPESWKYLQEDLALDNGHLLDQVLKRNGILQRTVHKELGIILQKKCCWNLQRVDILFSVQQLHCPGVSSIQAGTVSRLRFWRRPWGLKKSTSGGTLCIFGCHTFVPISWMCKKQTSVSHSSTEWEIFSLHARLRLDGISALNLWDLIVSILGNISHHHDRTGRPVVHHWNSHTIHKRKQSRRLVNNLDNVDFIPSNVEFDHQDALSYVFEDNEAVIKMIIKGRSPSMRHVSRTHRVALDWLLDRTNLFGPQDPNQIHWHRKQTRRHWQREISHVMNGIIFCVDIGHFSSIKCSEVVSKRTQADSSEESQSKIKTDDELGLTVTDPNVLATSALESPRKTRSESQIPLSPWNEQHPRNGETC